MDTMTEMKNSPLQISEIHIGNKLGKIGISSCPGLKEKTNFISAKNRDLNSDIDTISSWNPRVALTLMEQQELEEWGIKELGNAITNQNIDWYHMPIQDMSIPDPNFEAEWVTVGSIIQSTLRDGNNVYMHCRGGLGRSGTVAARILVELGWSSDQAIAKVREIRPGSIETKAQEDIVRRSIALQRKKIASALI